MLNFESGFYLGLLLGCFLYVPFFVWHAHRIHAEITKELGK